MLKESAEALVYKRVWCVLVVDIILRVVCQTQTFVWAIGEVILLSGSVLTSGVRACLQNLISGQAPGHRPLGIVVGRGAGEARAGGLVLIVTPAASISFLK